MWIKLPLTGDFTLHYIWRDAPLENFGDASLKKYGPFANRQTLSMSEGWANTIKQFLGEDPAPFDFGYFASFLDGHVRFRAGQHLDTAKTGWAGEFFGALAYLQTRNLTRHQIVRLLAVSGTTKYPDFALYNWRDNSVVLLECKASGPVFRHPQRLDLCKILNGKRIEGKEKAVGRAHTWLQTANEYIYVEPIPANQLVVVGAAFVDGSLRQGVAQVDCVQSVTGNEGCSRVCMNGGQSQAAFAFFENPISARIAPEPPGSPDEWFTFLQSIMGSAWAGAPRSFYGLVEDLVQWFGEHPPRDVDQPEAYWRVRFAGYLAKLAVERIGYRPDNSLAWRLIRAWASLDDDPYTSECLDQLLGFPAFGAQVPRITLHEFFTRLAQFNFRSCTA